MPNVPSSQFVNDSLPQGIDWADGLNGHLGTAPASNSIIAKSANGATSGTNFQIEEEAESPTIERAEQATIVHTYRLPYDQALNRLAIYGRGALVSDSSGNVYRVLSSSVRRRGKESNQASLTITAESVSFDVPPDEFQITPVKLGIDLLKHPRYFYALMPSNQISNFSGTPDTNAQIAAKQVIIRALQAYRENPFIPQANVIGNITGALHDDIVATLKSNKLVVPVPNINFKPEFTATEPDKLGTDYSGNPYPPVATINGQPNPKVYYVSFDQSQDPSDRVEIALGAAQEIIMKLWRLEDTPLLNGFEITWSEYYFRPPAINGGSYIENPAQATPPLPDYFLSTAYPPNASQTIFDMMAEWNPQCFSSTGSSNGAVNISWLRDADSIEYQRTWFKVTRKWLGAPIGAWDAEIYTTESRPKYATDYQNLVLS